MFICDFLKWGFYAWFLLCFGWVYLFDSKNITFVYYQILYVLYFVGQFPSSGAGALGTVFKDAQREDPFDPTGCVVLVPERSAAPPAYLCDQNSIHGDIFMSGNVQ